MSRKPRAVAIAEDAAPEADRLEGFAHPRQTTALIGQEAAEREMAGALVSGRLHHAWLLAGPEGVGKATLAYRFARAALDAGRGEARFADPGPPTLDVAPESIAARQVLALSHPGLIVIRRAWDAKGKRFPTAIGVDEVRRLKPFLGLTVADGGRRIVIVDRADELNINAANALLKSIEEPPSGTVFLLIASEPGRLLRTIHSRCRRLDLPPLGIEALSRALAHVLAAAGKEPVAPDRLTLLHGLSGGSARRALVLASGAGLKLYDRVVALAAKLPKLDTEAGQKLADELSPLSAEQELETFFSLLQGLIGRLVRHAMTGTGALGGEVGIAARIGEPGKLASFAAMWETLAREKAQTLALNLDRKALILDTFRRLETASRG